jgi:hypothetical protein
MTPTEPTEAPTTTAATTETTIQLHQHTTTCLQQRSSTNGLVQDQNPIQLTPISGQQCLHKRGPTRI